LVLNILFVNRLVTLSVTLHETPIWVKMFIENLDKTKSWDTKNCICHLFYQHRSNWRHVWRRT